MPYRGGMRPCRNRDGARKYAFENPSHVDVVHVYRVGPNQEVGERHSFEQ